MTRRAQALHGIALLLAACLAQAEPLGYVVNSDSLSDADFDQLYRVDLATGDATLIGDVGYGDVEGLALSPEGVLYGVDDATETLITIDTSTGAGSAVNNTASNLTLGPCGLELGANHDFGLTFDFEGTLWLSSDVTGRTWRIDPETGEPEDSCGGSAAAGVTTDSGDGGKVHGSDEPHFTGLAACGNTTYGVTVTDPRSLYRLDPPERVGALDAGLVFDDGGLDFDGNGTLWGVADRSTFRSAEADEPEILNEPSIVFTVDPLTGEASRVGTILVGVEALAIGPPGPCLHEQALSHPMPALSPAGLVLLVLTLGLGAATALRMRPGA